MHFKAFQPSIFLQPYVTEIWDYVDLLADDNLKLSILPDTAIYLCFLYSDSLTTTHKSEKYTIRSGVAGIQSFRSDLDGLGEISGVSVRLKSWGLNVFCRGIVKECTNQRVDCRDIFPKYSIEAIEDKLSIQKSAENRIKCVEHFLLSILNHNNEDSIIQIACKKLDSSNGNYPISMLARSLGLSERTLERRFKTYIGITPKKYARIVRLRSTIFQRKNLSSWAEVAQIAGYYDQSHMINDFNELYGMSPETIYPQMKASQTLQFSGLLNLNHLP